MNESAQVPPVDLTGSGARVANTAEQDTSQLLVPEICIVGANGELRAVEGGRAGSEAVPTTLLVSIVILAKTIVGAGMASLPHSFQLLGLGVALAFLLLVAWLTHFSLEALTLGSLKTERRSFPAVVETLCGRAWSTLLEICLVFRGAGLMVVYLIVAADILAGHPGKEGGTGMLCDLSGGMRGCSSRTGVTAVVCLLILVPLVSARRLSSTAIVSWVGLGAVVLWSGVTLVLSALAWHRGQGHPVPMAPNWDALGHSSSEIMSNLLGVIPVIATAYTCQMTIHFVMDDMGHTFSQARLSRTSVTAVGICTILYVVVAVGSDYLFGEGVVVDVLENFSYSGLRPLVGGPVARALDMLIRLGFLLSCLANFPAQMWPYRAAAARLVLRRELESTAALRLLSYASLVLFWGTALGAGSIWIPMQLVGATAGALIAFILPGVVALAARDCEAAASQSRAYWTAGAWALIVLGIVQGVAGTLAALLFAGRGQEGAEAR